ncbi:unnamed protein product [Paramecium sonneborni]|uniref:WD domain, G-beta repeat protein n=1 Tax=Paramecium sonneborni TaxID=65129 RepID=A0A8S1R623_9CILI|nr:unnamed protein product [Paramecium sonneborni]
MQIYEGRQALECIFSTLIPFKDINFEQLTESRHSEVENLISDFCQLDTLDELLAEQFQQSILQIIQISDYLKIYLKNLTNQSQNFEKKDKQSIVLSNFIEEYSIGSIQQQMQYTNSKILNQMKVKAQKEEQIIHIDDQLNLIPFSYQLIHQRLIQLNKYCQAITMNKDCSQLIVGCNNQIQVYEFQQNFLSLIQVLNNHTQYVNTLNFFKNSNQFVSGSQDNYIIIWSLNKNNNWACQQKLHGHTQGINSLVQNINEDMIISGSNDCSIKFWKKKNSWLCYQTIIEHKKNVLGLSLNQSQNKLISCGSDKLILILEQSQQTSKWVVIQKITLQIYGSRLCFINDNLFVFQPEGIEQLYIYQMNKNNKQYSKTKEFILNGGKDGFYSFPQQYIKSKCLLVSKNANYVNLIRIIETGEFITEQSIKFGTNFLFGYMSDDAQFLITWDLDSSQLQIRKYLEK